MRQPYRLFSLFGVLALILTACQGSTPAPATATATEPPATATASITAAPQATGQPVDCKLYTSPFAEVTAKDWATGPENALVTIIEYSDFQ